MNRAYGKRSAKFWISLYNRWRNYTKRNSIFLSLPVWWTPGNGESLHTGNHTGGKIRNDHPKKCRKYAGKRFLWFTPSVPAIPGKCRLEPSKTGGACHSEKRDSLSVLQDTKRILLALEESTVLRDLWKRYQAQNLYAREITYPAIMETVEEFTEKMNF